jgi:hypothetical protein
MEYTFWESQNRGLAMLQQTLHSALQHCLHFQDHSCWMAQMQSQGFLPCLDAVL